MCTFNNTVVDIVNWCLSMRGKNTLLDTVSFQKTRYWTRCPFKKHVIGHGVLSKNTLLDTMSFQKTRYWTRCPFKKHVIGHGVLSKNMLLDTVSFQKTRYWTRCPFKKHVIGYGVLSKNTLLDTVSFHRVIRSLSCLHGVQHTAEQMFLVNQHFILQIISFMCSPMKGLVLIVPLKATTDKRRFLFSLHGLMHIAEIDSVV